MATASPSHLALAIVAAFADLSAAAKPPRKERE